MARPVRGTAISIPPTRDIPRISIPVLRLGRIGIPDIVASTDSSRRIVGVVWPWEEEGEGSPDTRAAMIWAGVGRRVRIWRICLIIRRGCRRGNHDDDGFCRWQRQGLIFKSKGVFGR